MRLLAQARRDSETKTLFLNEVNHRVKNNLASIIGLLELESDREIHSTSDFQIALNRYQNHESADWQQFMIFFLPINGRQFNLELFVQKVIDNASASSPIGRKLQLDIMSQERNLWINSRQATALALILNELTTNSIRHAFSDRENGTITVTIRLEDKELKSCSHLLC